MPWCSLCRRVRPRAEFYYGHADQRLGRRCKPCVSDCERERRVHNRGILNRYKLKHGCARCGYRARPEALQFHHRDPRHKRFDIGQRMCSATRRLIKEIEQCEVLCANCHAIVTADEGHHIPSMVATPTERIERLPLFDAAPESPR